MIFRWTMGPTIPVGVDMLLMSIRFIQKLYPDAKLFVCHNKIDINSISLPNVVQTFCQDGITLPVKTNTWVLTPQRLDPDDHEIFLDNDLILFKRLPQIDSLLEYNVPCVTEGKWGGLTYGAFQNSLPSNFRINSGLFGVPPMFNFEESIQKLNILHLSGKGDTHFDNQGVIADAMYHTKANVIPQSDVVICEPHEKFKNAKCGVHFVKGNRETHYAWQTFQSNTTLQ